MKKARTGSKKKRPAEEMLAEYRFDYGRARPNRFAHKLKPGGKLFLLDHDVAEAFKTPEAVNSALRAILAVMPKPDK
jgi:hypothetical protein